MREYPQIRLRVSPELKEAVEQSAKSSGRSMNAEIAYRIEQSLHYAEQQYPGVIQPAISAKMARKIAVDNKELGLPSALSDAINEKIMAACTIGISAVELDLAEFNLQHPASLSMLRKAITTVQQAFEQEGYVFETNENKIIITF